MVFNTYSILLYLINVYQTSSNGLSGLLLNPVNEIFAYEEELPTIALIKNDNFMIAWSGGTSQTQTGSCPPNCYYNIYFNIFDAYGAQLSAHQTLVNIPGNYKATLPAAISDGNGGFVITWEQIDSNYNDIYVRHYDADLVPGNIIKVNTIQVNDFVTSALAIDRLMNGNYIIAFRNFHSGYDLWAQIIDANISLVGTMFSVSDSLNGKQISPSALGLQNGGFTIAWQNDSTNSGNWEIFAKIYNKYSQPITTEFLVNTNNSNGTQKSPSLAQLKNGNIVITWADMYLNSGDIYAAVYDQNGISLKQAFLINQALTLNIQDLPNVVSMTFGGCLVFWQDYQTAVGNIYMQVYDENFNLYAPPTKFSWAYPLNVKAIDLVNELGLVAVLQNKITTGNGTDIVAQLIYLNQYSCQQISNFRGSQQSSIKIELKMDLTNTIKVTSLPTKGQLKRGDGTVILNNAFISSFDLYYTITSQGSDSFTYITDNNDTPCNYNIILCYVSCFSCDKAGDVNNNNCTACDTGKYYYPIFNSLDGNCYLKTQKLKNYYFDSSVNLFKTCYSSCDYCSQNGNAQTNNCDACATSYYPLEGNVSQCYLATDIINGYYFDNKQFQFMLCYNSCLKCKLKGDDLNHNCLKCKDGYAYLIDNQNNCYLNEIVIPGYYFDTALGIFNYCYTTCNTCSGPGTASNPNCIDCKKEYANCNSPINAENAFIQLNCTNKIFHNYCVDECPKYTIADPLSNKCLYCNTNQAIFNNTCVDECPQNYIRDNSNICKQCSPNTYYYDKQCVNTCPTDTKLNPTTNICEVSCENGFYQIGVGCVKCESVAKYYYKNSCYESCPEHTLQVGGICQDYIEHSSI
jgi:hypothetical protein